MNLCEVPSDPMHGYYGEVMSKIINHLCAVLGAAFVAITVTAVPAVAQRTPLTLGTINKGDVIKLKSCPAGYYPGMTCFRGQVDNCANATSLSFTYGYEDPQGEPVGTVMFLEGGGGTTPYDHPTYAQKYLQNGFQVVYATWDSDWELTGAAPSIKYAACRPATLLNYIYENIYSRGGMCAQGSSAGSGALGYALAWYGSSSFLDSVELLSGPVFGDIKQGCEVPDAPTVNVCATGQFGCDGAEWPDSPAYVDGDQNLIRNWSNQPSCNAGKTTSASVNALWKEMSIVDGTEDPSFTYPQTALAGYLCSNVDSVQNNSAAQGEFFYQQFTSTRQTASYSLTRINHCSGTEGVTDGETPQGETGFVAVSDHMLSSCIKRH
jgi:hypothetical protein